MIISTEDPVTLETRELIATCDVHAIGARCDGFSKIAAEYARLRIAAPANLLDAIDALRATLDVLVNQGERYARIERDLAADEDHDLNANTELWEG